MEAFDVSVGVADVDRVDAAALPLVARVGVELEGLVAGGVGVGGGGDRGFGEDDVGEDRVAGEAVADALGPAEGFGSRQTKPGSPGCGGTVTPPIFRGTQTW